MHLGLDGKDAGFDVTGAEGKRRFCGLKFEKRGGEVSNT
jgi:hypothetical protein